MKNSRFSFCLLVVTFLAAGCTTLGRNPLEGWKGLGSAFVIGCPFDQAVANDYRSYIQNLPLDEKSSVHDHDIRFFEAIDGERAVEISIPLDGIWWKHVLFYNKEDKRIKAIKYAASRYMS